MSADFVNSLFEFVGVGAVMLSAHNCFKHKSAAGVHWFSTLFFALWGWWNLYYYNALEQPISFLATVLMIIVQTIYLALVVKYSFFKKDVDCPYQSMYLETHT